MRRTAAVEVLKVAEVAGLKKHKLFEFEAIEGEVGTDGLFQGASGD